MSSHRAEEAMIEGICSIIQVCRKLREKFGSVNIPIVMCTALTAGHKALDECKQKGATDHLLKPYDRLKMIAIIEKYCGDKVKCNVMPFRVYLPVLF